MRRRMEGTEVAKRKAFGEEGMTSGRGGGWSSERICARFARNERKKLSLGNTADIHGRKQGMPY